MSTVPKTPAPKPQTTYTVRWKGAVVGTKGNTSVRYAHAVIGQLHEATVRKWAYAAPGKDKQYRELFNWYEEVVRGGPSLPAFDREFREFAKARVADGFAAFAAQYRKRRIEWFEQLNKDGGPFGVSVIKWCRPGEVEKTKTDRNVLDYSPANELAADETNQWTFDWTKVVPVETETTIPVAQRFTKLPKKAQRELLGLVCDKMIERQAWGEIAGLLTAYLESDDPLITKLLDGRQ
jgi:hypothetical protein